MASVAEAVWGELLFAAPHEDNIAMSAQPATQTGAAIVKLRFILGFLSNVDHFIWGPALALLTTGTEQRMNAQFKLAMANIIGRSGFGVKHILNGLEKKFGSVTCETTSEPGRSSTHSVKRRMDLLKPGSFEKKKKRGIIQKI